jgi:site-specific DNA-cytosine methylase
MFYCERTKGVKYTYVVDFGGGGGSSIGLQQAGGIEKCIIEWVPPGKNGKLSRQIPYDHLVANFPALYRAGGIINEDAHKVSGQKILKITNLKPGELDIYQSSAPCQAFSSSNTKSKVSDPRNYLFFTSIGRITVVKPKIVVFEDVAGLAWEKNKLILSMIFTELRKAGYMVKAWILKASDYGAPQSRPRLWIIAIRNDICDALQIEPSYPPYAAKVGCVRDVLPNILGVRAGQFAKKFHPATEPCPTITRTAGEWVQDKNGIFRKPTLVELCKLSTWPKGYKFLYPQTYSINHALLGNAVLPLMMKVLAEHLYNTVLVPWNTLMANNANAA